MLIEEKVYSADSIKLKNWTEFQYPQSGVRNLIDALSHGQTDAAYPSFDELLNQVYQFEYSIFQAFLQQLMTDILPTSNEAGMHNTTDGLQSF